MKFAGKSLFGFLVAAALGLALLAVLSVWLLPGQYACQQTVERSFTLDDDFTQVRKILVRTDATKQIVTMTGDSEYLDQDWKAVGGGLDSFSLLDPQWRLELYGTLQVRTDDPYIGQHDITLRQEVKIEPDLLRSEVELKKASDRLREYEMMTAFERDAARGTTIVRQRLTEEILTDAPWFAHGIADRRVRASITRAAWKTRSRPSAGSSTRIATNAGCCR